MLQSCLTRAHLWCNSTLALSEDGSIPFPYPALQLEGRGSELVETKRKEKTS